MKNFGGAFITSGHTPGGWSHVVWTYNGTTGASKIYIDGVVLRETTNENTQYPINSPVDVLVGTRYTMANSQSSIDRGQALAGKIDDLRFYADAPVEYFNLQGMRMQGKLVPGIYIRRQGSEVTKVLVR